MLTSSQDIKEREALRDWEGKKTAEEIQRKHEAIEREKSLIKELEEEVEPYDDIDHTDLMDEEVEVLRQFKRKLRSSRYIPFSMNSSGISLIIWLALGRSCVTVNSSKSVSILSTTNFTNR